LNNPAWARCGYFLSKQKSVLSVNSYLHNAQHLNVETYLSASLSLPNLHT
jgi:hypothetical protein